MKNFNVFMKNGLILTFSSLVLRFIAVVFNIFLSNKIPISILGIWGIVMSVFSFLLTIALSRN
ncbi:MAG: hypothetical protein J6K42_00070 [Clostridia bacterium]|nr:hypothetical protein [Clostridia bacterium]